jgi:ATP-binding cassette subfamily B protein
MIFNTGKFPFFKQYEQSDCGIACLRMIAKYYGKEYRQEDLTRHVIVNRIGISIYDLSTVADKIGFRSLGIETSWKNLMTEVQLPAIVHWDGDHFVVVYKITGSKIYIADPRIGLCQYTHAEFCMHWLHHKKENTSRGVVLLLEPSPDFFSSKHTATNQNKASLGFIIKNSLKFRFHFLLLIVGLLLGSLLQLFIPFITQSIVDLGIIPQDIDFLRIIILAQLFVFVSITIVDFLRTWILIHISSRMNVYIISDFLMKLMSLPIHFFDTKTKGDIMQRIQDHERVRSFLTDTLLKSLFSLFSIVVLCTVLAAYNFWIFTAFLLLTVLEMTWIFIFLKHVRKVDNESFVYMAEEQGKLHELISGINEIKLHNVEQKKRWEWEYIQSKLFKVNLKRLRLNQRQEGIARTTNYLLVVVINFITASLVLEGKLSLGSMLAVTSILGLLNVPVTQLINFVLRGHIAKMSLERMGQIHALDSENKTYGSEKQLPADRSIYFTNVGFSFGDDSSSFALDNINLTIPAGKITAIVGLSGSGKTTLIKLLLKFYDPQHGSIRVGHTDLREIQSPFWRAHCGAVLQDGFIFSDSIASNIALAPSISYERLKTATEIANIHDFIASLPQGVHTKIGPDGIGLSQGQKQRILIARAVYKNPEYLVFDEATNALDAQNERIIMRNLEKFYQGRTVIIIAHRLSTIKRADQIVLIENGKISESGTHITLIDSRSKYYSLVESQMEVVS